MSRIRLVSMLLLPLVCVVIYDLRNSSVFNACLKVCSDGSDVIAGGSMFQTLAAAAGKAQLPMVLCNDRGTCNSAVDDDRRCFCNMRLCVLE